MNETGGGGNGAGLGAAAAAITPAVIVNGGPTNSIRMRPCPCDAVQLPADLGQLAHETWAHTPLPQPQGHPIRSGINERGNHWQVFDDHGAQELLYHNKARPLTGVQSDWMRRSDGVCFYRETPDWRETNLACQHTGQHVRITPPPWM